MAIYKNYGTVIKQKFIDEFNWKGKLFYSYIIQFKEYEGLFRIVRESSHEQALIGANMMFNYSQEKEQIEGYRIVSYQEVKVK